MSVLRKDNNPFEPGAGTKPQELIGRELVLEDAEAAIARGWRGRAIRGQIFYGLRGVGKTVLLREVSDSGRRRGAFVLDLEAPEDKSLAELLVPAIRQLLIDMSRSAQVKAKLARATGALRAFAAGFRVKVGDIALEVKARESLADSGDLEADVSDLLVAIAEAAQAQKTVVLIAIDEMQYLDEDEFSALIAALHKINQKALPLGLFGAGLPQLLGTAGKAKSYSERLFTFAEIGALSEGDAKRVIRNSVVSAGAEIEASAVEYIVGQSQGYPYFVQEWGFRVWNEAQRSPIRLDDARRAADRTIASLDKSFFRVRFDRLSPREQQYLRAMAEIGPGPHKSADVAKVIGKSIRQTAPARSQVIEKGMAYSGQYGEVAFSVPLFDQFMKRIIPVFDPKQEADPPQPTAIQKKPRTKPR